MRGCFSRLGTALLLAMLLGPFIGVSLYVDLRGITAAGTVLAKRETIKHSITGSWVRTMNVRVSYQPHDERGAVMSDIDLDGASYDRLHAGSPVTVKYAPNRTLRAFLILPTQRLVGQSTLSWLRLQFNSSALRDFVLAVPGIVFFLFWLFTRAGQSMRWRALPFLGWGILMAVVVLRPILVATPSTPPQIAKATVKQIDRITIYSRRQSSHGHSFTGKRNTDLLYPYDLVQLEWTPPGLDTPVQSVDGIDPDSVPGLDVGSVLPISYPADNPRAAQLIGATRQHRWVNALTLPAYGFAFFCLWLVWMVITWIVGRSTARLRP